MTLADEALVLARRQRDGAATTTALRAQGLAARSTGELAVAEEKLRRAVRLALRRDDQHSAAEARMTLSFVLLDAGKVKAALRQSGLASTVLDGVEGARLLAQHGLILQRCGRSAAALQAYFVALEVLRQHDDLAWESRVCSNRGVLLAYQGQAPEAEHDLRRAREIDALLGRGLDVAMSTWNLGFVAARRGDAVGALALFDEADPEFDRQGVGRAERAVDRARVLLSVGMAEQARALLAEALEDFRRTGQATDAMECRLLLGRAALEAGDPETAVAQALAARREASRQQRGAWALLARHLELVSREASGQHGPGLRRRAEQLVQALDAAGWREAAGDARLTAARLAASHGMATRTQALLGPLARDRSRGHEIELRRWHATALLREGDGDVAGALRAVERGMDVLERRRATLAASDMQIHVPNLGLALARIGVELAWRTESPGRLFAILERWRAQNLIARPVRPPKDVRFSAALDELRRASDEILTARMAGGPTAALLGAHARLEREVVRASHSVRALGVRTTSVARAAEIREALGDGTLVHVFARGDELGAVTVSGPSSGGPSRARGPVVTRLGSLHECLHEVAHLQFALARLASGRGSAETLAAARRSADASARRLNGLLLAPLKRQLSEGRLVIVPSDGLHAVPWNLLPDAGSRPRHVVPSATSWLAARRRFLDEPPAPGDRTVVITGPRLGNTERETSGIARHVHGVEILDGAAATVGGTLAGLRGARVAHIAAHGRFEVENPMLSSLQLADGPLMMYDLEALDPPPLHVVLAACHSAVARLHAGHELLGLAHALLWFGSSGVVATSLPAPDSDTAVLVQHVHEGLTQGLGVAESLWLARRHVDTSTPAGYATVAGFEAYGY
jgi:tetratricopeptide (TPR) repeat protein